MQTLRGMFVLFTGCCYLWTCVLRWFWVAFIVLQVHLSKIWELPPGRCGARSEKQCSIATSLRISFPSTGTGVWRRSCYMAPISEIQTTSFQALYAILSELLDTLHPKISFSGTMKEHCHSTGPTQHTCTFAQVWCKGIQSLYCHLDWWPCLYPSSLHKLPLEMYLPLLIGIFVVGWSQP